MIRRLALTAGFAVLGAMALAPKAHAQAAPATEMVPFAGSVGSVCTLSNPEPGILGLTDPANPTVLDSEATDGQSGSITVNCSGENQVSVTEVTPGEVPEGFTAQSTIAKLSDGINSTDNDASPDPLNVTNGSEVTLEVNLQVTSDTALPPGSYEYNVMVTAAPQ